MMRSKTLSNGVATAPHTHAAPTAAYLHIPFCRRRCFYCDFAVSVVGDRPPVGEQFGTIAEYVEMLCQEIQAVSPDSAPLQTIFFGGGTPSLLTVTQLEQILAALRSRFEIADHAEISIEIDPDTFDQARLSGYRAAGINRVSLGVQAFQTELLSACGRTHKRADVDAAIAIIQQVGLTNFSLDLISGLPHQTMAQWQESLQLAIQLAPTHLAIYDLTVEPGTAFDRWYEAGMQPLPTDAATAQMYRLAQQTLTAAGYQHYEVSNYARPGFECRHNRTYWENRSYYGFGMGAASYWKGQRFIRPRKRRDYYNWVQDFRQTGQIDCPVTPAAEALLDCLMLGLRLSEGVSLEQLRATFGAESVSQVLSCIEPHRQQGWVEIFNNQLRLADPEGFLFSNVVLSDLFKRLS
jgi:putative oxygen-independent coproporphyrinogen III oxidase